MFDHIPASEIVVKRGERQRRQLEELDPLVDSIKQVGILNPVIIDKDKVLIAGERRLTAARRINKDFPVPVRFFENMSEHDRQLIELEENVKRLDLHWKDECMAYLRLHELYQVRDPEWTMVRTAGAAAVSSATLAQRLQVAEALRNKNPLAVDATNLSQALARLQRETQRAVDNEMNELFQDLTIGKEPSPVDFDLSKPQPVKTDEKGDVIHERQPLPRISSPVIEQGNFLEIAQTYSGRKFNLIHCDFPYGIDHGESDQGGTKDGMWEGYEDSADTYWELCAALAMNLDRLALPSCHIVFWLSMKYYAQTVDFFQRNTDLKVDPIPLVWHKSDNKGIIRDTRHTPRNVCEYALLMTRGDRHIISPIANGYSCPTYKSKAIHVSEKPEPMLKHFFRMFIDEASEVLDPTCGGGSAIRAAQAMGAKRVQGWELNQDFADAAQKAYTSQLALAAFTKSTTKPKDHADEPAEE